MSCPHCTNCHINFLWLLSHHCVSLSSYHGNGVIWKSLRITITSPSSWHAIIHYHTNHCPLQCVTVIKHVTVYIIIIIIITPSRYRHNQFHHQPLLTVCHSHWVLAEWKNPTQVLTWYVNTGAVIQSPGKGCHLIKQCISAQTKTISNFGNTLWKTSI